ncbi:rod shape-determining protein MreC [bacterium]|nr:rod shape-determining protein MreC [bacterium]
MHSVWQKLKENHSFIVWLVIAVLAILLYNLDIGIKHNIGELFQSTIFYPFEKLVVFTKDLQDHRKENLSLKHKVTQLSLRIDLLLEEKKENERLREVLDFRESFQFETIIAQVIGKGSLRNPSYILVDKGSAEGVCPNAPVVVQEGIVGKVVEVFNHSSLIMPIFNHNFKVSALDAITRVVGIVEWKGGGFLQMDGVPITETATVGDIIISSGYGLVFPRGLKIGVVHRVDNPKDKLFKTIDIIPFADPTKVEEIFIIIGEHKNEEHLDLMKEYNIE